MTRFLFRTLCFLVFPPLPAPMFALNLPRRVVADALWVWFTYRLILVRLFFLCGKFAETLKLIPNIPSTYRYCNQAINDV
jgi:hypothetical protein